MQLGLPALPDAPPEQDALSVSSPTPTSPPAQQNDVDDGAVEEKEERPTQTAIDLHRILLETTIREGKLVCGNCGHEYAVKEGVANFLLPGHLV